jgi:hypothetical protein
VLAPFDAGLLRTRDGCLEGGITEGSLFVPEGDSITAIGVGPEAFGVVLAAVGRPSVGAAIWRSTEGGAPQTFAPLYATAGFDIVEDFAWNPEDPKHVLAVSAWGAVYESDTVGETWAVRREAVGTRHHRLVFHPTDGSTVFLTHEFGVDRSTNSGGDFLPHALAGEDVTGLEIAVNDPSVIFASARGTGVFRSFDGGVSWDSPGEGLLHRDLLDLQFRPESDHLYAGTIGGGVYRLDAAGRIGPDADLDAVADDDDNCPGTPNNDQANGDGDARGDACDCMPADASVYGVPGEVSGLMLSWDGAAVLRWDDPRGASGPGTRSEVIDGDLSDLLEGGVFDGARCLASDLSEPLAVDGRPAPPAGKGVYYLVRAVNACGDGTFGNAAATHDPRDDLDQAPPCASPW